MVDNKTISDMQNQAKKEVGKGKYVIIPTNMKKVEKSGKSVAFPTKVEIKRLDK